ncbi:MAG: hypothetical protein KAR40_06190 [Candidatus Sabulitectum sp.]|nr:hypothetical protein [Candidatus Sabulitectum sp.]
MNDNKQIETADKVAAIINNVDSDCNARVWAKGNMVRVYTAKGYAIIDNECNCNIDGLGGYCYKAALYCDDNGIKTYRA